MEIKLDGDAVASIAATAIFEAMDIDTRNSVIQQALSYLLTPAQVTSGYNNRGASETPLQQAFNQGVRDATFKLVREYITESEEIKQGILSMLGPLITAALEGEASVYRYGLSESIGHAVGQWLAEQSRKE